MVNIVLSIHNTAFKGAKKSSIYFLDVNYGDSPMHLIVRNGNYELLQILLKHNIYLREEDESRHTPIQLAAILGRTEMIKCMLNYYDDNDMHEKQELEPTLGDLLMQRDGLMHRDERELLILRSTAQLTKRVIYKPCGQFFGNL